MDHNPYEISLKLEKSSPYNYPDQNPEADSIPGLDIYTYEPVKQASGGSSGSSVGHGIHHQQSTTTDQRSNTNRFAICGVVFILLCAIFLLHDCDNPPKFSKHSPTTTRITTLNSSGTLTAPATVNTWTIGGYSAVKCGGDSLLNEHGTTTSDCFHNSDGYISYALYQQPEQRDWTVCRYNTQDCTGAATDSDLVGCTTFWFPNVRSLKVIPNNQECPGELNLP